MNRDPSLKLPTVARILSAVGFGLAVVAGATGVAAGRLDPEATAPSESVAAALHSAALQSAVPSGEPAHSYSQPTAAEPFPTGAMPRSATPADRTPGSNRLAAKPSPAARVDVRCWQHGILIVNERRLLPAVEPFPYVVKFPSREPGGVPVYLGAWASATCMIKPAAE